MRINITYTGPHPHRLHYVLGFIQGHPYTPSHVILSLNNWNDTEIRIDYSPRAVPIESDEYYMPAYEKLFAYGAHNESWQLGKYTFAKRNIYSIEREATENKKFIENRRFGFDIFETIFFHLTRHEEYHADSSDKDQWDMLHEYHHFLVRHDLHHVPVVDHIVEAWLLSIGIEPVQFPSKLTVTHDIDVLEKFPDLGTATRAVLGSLWRDRSISKAISVYRLYCQVRAGTKQDPYDTFDDLLTEGDFRKVIYFLAGGRSKYDRPYDLTSSRFQEIYRLAKAKGYQIGIHPSYESYDDYEIITREKKTLESAIGSRIRTSRQHFLRFSFQETITALSDSGIYEDSTLGYQRKVGFRCGTAFTYLMYDLRRDRNSKISQTPMVVMDGALLDECNADYHQAGELVQRFVERYKSNSHLTINFHNTIFDPTRYDSEAMWDIYKMILENYRS